MTAVKCLPSAALAVVLVQLPNLYLLGSGRGLRQPLQTSLRNPTFVALYVLGILLPVFLNAVILLKQHRIVTGSTLGGELSAVARRAPAVVVMTLLFTLGTVACLAPAWLLRAPLRPAALILLLGPATYLFISLSAALPALLMSGSGPLASLKRSWRLTRGNLWRLALVYGVAAAILTVGCFLLGAASGFFIGLVLNGDVAVATAVFTVVVLALVALAVPFYTAVQLAVFADLTARREGTDLAQRISAVA